ncbi:MAG: LruC domain-containing protein [Bacteroidota bacterium]
MRFNYILFGFSLLFMVSCIGEPEIIDDPDNPVDNLGDFSYEMTKSVELDLSFKDLAMAPITKVPVNIWEGDPFDGGKVVFKSLTDDAGAISEFVSLPTHLAELTIEIGYPGLKNYVRKPIAGNQLSYHVAGFDTESDSYEPEYDEEGNVVRRIRNTDVVINYMGTYNSQGVPDYLEPTRDVISTELLSFINSSLPEGYPVPTYHPRYLDSSKNVNLEVISTSDVWITFVHEGAGWRNAIGFYTYPTGSRPPSPGEIDSINIIFPNASFAGGGGGLRSGDKVLLGQFPAGTTIGFVLFANAWNGNSQTVGNGYYKIYSDIPFNPESDPSLNQHHVLLYDEINELFLIGFEDINRESPSCDQDFNDAIFYVTANPITGLNNDNVNPIDQPGDSDNDGVSDVYDEAPNDPNVAYYNYYPSENTYGTLAFEDMWPLEGDYDFNDLVMDYQYKYVLNPTNDIVGMEMEFVIKAVGAGFQNGFGVQLNLNPSDIAAVSGYDIAKNYITLSNNGTESGQSKAVIIATDNTYNGFDKSGGFINTQAGDAYITPDTVRIVIDFSSNQTYSSIGAAPFNPFLIRDGNRGAEIHLPGSLPTDLADPSIFGTGVDGTNPSAGVYYKSPGKLPWAMNLPVSFAYPYEKEKIYNAHKMFLPWIQSDGFNFMDWYLDQPAYRDSTLLFK